MRIKTKYHRPSPLDYINQARIRPDRERLHFDVSLQYLFMREIAEWPGVGIEWEVNPRTKEPTFLILTPSLEGEKAYLYKRKSKWQSYVACPLDTIGRAEKFKWANVTVDRFEGGFRVNLQELSIRWTHFHPHLRAV